MKQLEEIKARASAATAGPWRLEQDNADDWEAGINDGDYPYAIHGPHNVSYESWGDEWKRIHADYLTRVSEVSEMTEADAQFITAARTDVPKLVAALESVEEVLTWLDEIAASDTSKRIATGGHVQAGGVASIIRNAITGALEAA